MTLPAGVSVLALIAVCIIGVGALLQIIGLATPEWTSLHVGDAFLSLGLWKTCGGTTTVVSCSEYDYGKIESSTVSSVRACQAFAILGMLASFLGLAMAGLSVVLAIMGKPKNAIMPVISLAGCVGSFIFILISIIVWGVKVHGESPPSYNIGYSFILSIIGGILINVGGVLAFLASKRVS